ncbi:hypothetical protein PIB30_026218 [Stylosanthes scabra]|uniref:Uncharacterized protein n=1 Tax=Stylosanthes scabra TaxID=79078 RepID=A0ABU6Z7Z6_9FABA|nr:hypothetical protein [Stylosanthes scabra]
MASSSEPAKDPKSMEIKAKLLSLNDELVKLEYNFKVYVVIPEEQEEEPLSYQQTLKLISDHDDWIQKAQSYIKDEVTPFLTAKIFQSYKTLNLLHRFINYNLLSRSHALNATILDPHRHEEDEVPEDIAKTVLKKTVYAAKGMLSEIRNELEVLHEQLRQQRLGEFPSRIPIKKITIQQYLEKESSPINLPYEYGCIENVRRRAVLAGIQLSKLLSQFMFSLSDRDEETLAKLVSKIKKSSEKSEYNFVVSKIDLVIDETTDAISDQKEQLKEKNKKMVVASIERDVNVRLMKQFCNGISDLEFVLCSENVPEETKMVNGARVKMEVVLGLMLYQMQGIRISVGKNNHSDHDSWKRIKTLIANLWKIELYIKW